MRLSDNFVLDEFLVSQTATRQGGEMLEQQQNPPDEVTENLDFLVDECLQPMRTLLKTSMRISSGYRSPALNEAIRGSANSQHCVGEAADVSLSSEFISRASRSRVKRILDNKIQELTGLLPRSVGDDAVNANFYLFAAVCLYRDEMSIHQVIHEYGEPGKPAWVHIGVKKQGARSEILLIGQGERRLLNLHEALMLGC